MFSQTVEYALRAAVCLAQHVGSPLTTQELADLTKVPPSYLSKVLQLLGKAGLIRATRGIGGGYLLAKAGDEMTVLEAISAIEPFQRIKTCPLGLRSHGTNLCPLHHRMDRVLADAEATFGETTLADLLRDPNRSTPLCEPRMVQLGVKSS